MAKFEVKVRKHLNPPDANRAVSYSWDCPLCNSKVVKNVSSVYVSKRATTHLIEQHNSTQEKLVVTFNFYERGKKLNPS